MKTQSEDDKVYIIGQPETNRQSRYIAYFWWIGIIACVIALIITLMIFLGNDKSNQIAKGEDLTEVNIVPKAATAPLFMGKEGVPTFLKWVGANLEYPDGYETEDARVVVSLIISKTGNVENVKIVCQPEEKAFGKQVIMVLKKCPKWTPAKLADGSPIKTIYTLPVRFSKAKR